MLKSLFLSHFCLYFLLIGSSQLFATAQYGDRLIVNEDTVWITSNPLESYFQQKGERTIGGKEMEGLCTALWRGYVATWKLERDSLFLVRIQTDYCGNSPKEVEIVPEFGSRRVFAKWASTTIVRPEGALLQYVHMGYASIYEAETFYEFKKGRLIRSSRKEYLERDESLLFPNEYFLQDTLSRLVLASIPMSEREEFEEDQSCFLYIHFNQAGELSKIELGLAKTPPTILEKSLLSHAKEVLQSFPRLMQVKHENYSPPMVELWFRGYCLKHTEDKAYGCRGE